MLPLLKRELLVAARRPLIFRLRAAFGGGAMALSAWAILVWGSSAAFSGGAFFYLLFWITNIAALLAGLIVAIDSISLERREGTLPLLFLTNLSAWEIVAGKLAAASLTPLLTLLSVFPSLAIWQLLGGLAVDELLRAVVVLLITLMVSITVTLFVSSVARERMTVVLGAVSLLLVFNPLWLAAFSRLLSLWDFLLVSIACVLLSFFFLVATVTALNRNWRTEFSPKEKALAQSRGRQVLDEEYPVRFMLTRTTPSRGVAAWFHRAAPWIVGATGVWMIASRQPVAALVMLLIFHVGCILSLTARTAWTFSRKRDEGAFEILLSTPLRNPDIFEGFARYLHDQSRRFLYAVTAIDSAISILLWARGHPKLMVFPLAMCATLWITLRGVTWVGVYRSFMMNSPLLSAFWTFWRISFFPITLSALFLWAPKTDYAKVCFFWIVSTAFLSAFFGSDARRVLLERGRELLLRPACDRPPHIENDWTFINWDEINGELSPNNQ
jgi:hypothetical protein